MRTVQSGYMSIVVVLLLFITVGCSGVSVVGYPLENGKHMVQRTVSDPHAFSPTTQRSWMEVCEKKVTNDDFNLPEVEYKNCETNGLVQFSTTNGYLDGLGSAALYSGAIVGGAYFIGKGLGDSGSNVSQSGGGASQSQQQGQVQGQQQGIIQHGGGKR